MKRAVNPPTLQVIRSGAMEKKEHHVSVKQKVIELKGGKFIITEINKKKSKQSV